MEKINIIIVTTFIENPSQKRGQSGKIICPHQSFKPKISNEPIEKCL